MIKPPNRHAHTIQGLVYLNAIMIPRTVVSKIPKLMDKTRNLNIFEGLGHVWSSAYLCRI